MYSALAECGLCYMYDPFPHFCPQISASANFYNLHFDDYSASRSSLRTWHGLSTVSRLYSSISVYPSQDATSCRACPAMCTSFGFNNFMFASNDLNRHPRCLATSPAGHSGSSGSIALPHCAVPLGLTHSFPFFATSFSTFVSDMLFSGSCPGCFDLVLEILDYYLQSLNVIFCRTLVNGGRFHDGVLCHLFEKIQE